MIPSRNINPVPRVRTRYRFVFPRSTSPAAIKTQRVKRNERITATPPNGPIPLSSKRFHLCNRMATVFDYDVKRMRKKVSVKERNKAIP